MQEKIELDLLEVEEFNEGRKQADMDCSQDWQDKQLDAPGLLNMPDGQGMHQEDP